jgi:hypothetical protein
VPGGGFAGICGVESGKAAPLVGGPPGVELHTMVGGLPSKDDDDDRLPVALPAAGMEATIGPPDIVGTVDSDGVVPVVPLVAGMEVTCTAGVPGTICPVGMEQVTTVPGVVGSEASGTGASVVSGVPG